MLLGWSYQQSKWPRIESVSQTALRPNDSTQLLTDESIDHGSALLSSSAEQTRNDPAQPRRARRGHDSTTADSANAMIAGNQAGTDRFKQNRGRPNGLDSTR
jgi:hypothetical protein